MPTRELERIYDAHADALHALLLHLTRSEADTLDLLQEVFVRLAAREGGLESARNERAYLLRLAHNLAMDLFRRRDVSERKHDGLAREAVELFEPVAEPDEALFRAELCQALEALGPEQRAVVHLKLWEGLTFEEIADIVGISPNTAASRYRYGLDKLRLQLRPIYDEIR